MDLEGAIRAHQGWKSRLRMVIEGKTTEKLDPNVVCRDDQCELGQWIHGEGGQLLEAKTEFAELKATHADFHLVAANVIRKALIRDSAAAGELLDREFFQASAKVVQAINRCKAVCP